MPGESLGAPIGVFDSGVGGLSVLHELRTLLPRADLLYVADSGHCPYGGQPDAAIRARAHAIAGFLFEHEVGALVVACNTATSAAIDSLRATFPRRPIVGMEPAVKPAAAATRTGIVGVLATGATLGGPRFAGLAARFAEGIELLTQPCPGLVERVEAGDLDSHETVRLLRTYVEPLLARGADTLVLGCTHYPFLRPAIARVAGPRVALIDTGAAVARQVERVVGHSAEATGRTRAFTSDLRVAPVLERLWGHPLVVDELPV